MVVDTGHHAPGTNIEFIVADLLRGRASWAGSTSTRRFYADDDLMVGAADPFQLFRIMYEMRRRRRCKPEPAWPSCSTSATTSSRRSRGQIRSVMNVQEATAKALLVDREALRAAQAAGDVLGANARADGRLQHRRAAAAGRGARGAWA